MEKSSSKLYRNLYFKKMSKPGKGGTEQQVTDNKLAQENEKLTTELAQTKQLYERLLKESQEAETKVEERRAVTGVYVYVTGALYVCHVSSC